MTINNAQTFRPAGGFSGAGNVTKLGGGLMTMAGSSPSWSGNLYLLQGTTLFGGATPAGVGGTIFLGDIVGANGATLEGNSGPNGLNNPVVVRSGSTGVMSLSIGDRVGGSTFAGPVTLERDVRIVNNDTTGDVIAFTGGNDVALMAIPEPSTVGILLAGLGALLGGRAVAVG